MAKRNLNKIILQGNLVKDCEYKAIKDNLFLGVFSIAVNRLVSQREEVSFFDCEAWGKVVENIYMYMTKGKSVIIVGELIQDRFTTKDGKNASKVKINVSEIHLLGGASESRTEGKHEPVANDDIPF